MSALVAAIACCGCESSAPASTLRVDRPSPGATDWAGVRSTSAAPARPQSVAGDGTWVLHIGDSFADASFQQNLGPRIRASGARYVVEATTATYTTTWAYEPELERLLTRKPSLVVVTLGANEVDMPVPTQHARAVERIARTIESAGASCVWTTPPMWKADTGILQVIHDHCSPCVYFDSDAVLGGLGPDERQPDRIHPNKRGGARWADAFWSWLNDHRDASRPGWSVLPFEQREP
jgi:lysophospholipase L1-like esterase